VLVAFVVGVSIDDVLEGAWPGDRCPTCGGTGRCWGLASKLLPSAEF
jgi:hypothetical protein